MKGVAYFCLFERTKGGREGAVERRKHSPHQVYGKKDVEVLVERVTAAAVYLVQPVKE